MPNVTLNRVHQPSPEAIRELVNRLIAHNATKVGPEPPEMMLYTLRNDAGRLLGGLAGHLHWGWLFVSHLWLDDSLRGQGWGKRLLDAVEAEALAQGCRRAHLDTFSFQALDFYRSRGYRVFGQLEDYPQGSGHTRYYLTKDLA